MPRSPALLLWALPLILLAAPAKAGTYVEEDLDSDMTEVVYSAPPSLRDAEAIAAARYLERKPRGDAARGLRTMLLRWLKTSTAFSVIACDAVLTPLLNESTPNAAELLGQFMFGSAAHQIEHPEDRDAIGPNIVAGMRSMLQTYAALSARNPAAHIARFDALLQIDRQGRLAEELEPLMTHDCRAVISHD